jgi:hypothetical protein
VARASSTAFVLLLIAATAAAFALTQHAKLERSPIYAPHVDPVFSPNGKVKPVANIAFRVRPRERIDVWVQDAKGHRAATLLSNRDVRAKARVELVWDSITASGAAVPDGVYRPVVKLLRSHRTIVLPSDIRLDTRPPVITVHRPQYPIISPDGDGHADTFRVPYRIDERAHAVLLLRGKQIVFTRTQKQSGTIAFTGRSKSGKPLTPGRYVLAAAAQDVAGNRSTGFPFAIVQVRYVQLARSRVVVRPGGKFAIRVSTDHPTVSWYLRGRSGVQRRGTLHFRAPRKAGVYRLYVTVGSHAAKCAVVVA